MGPGLDAWGGPERMRYGGGLRMGVEAGWVESTWQVGRAHVRGRGCLRKGPCAWGRSAAASSWRPGAPSPTRRSPESPLPGDASEELGWGPRVWGPKPCTQGCFRKSPGSTPLGPPGAEPWTLGEGKGCREGRVVSLRDPGLGLHAHPKDPHSGIWDSRWPCLGFSGPGVLGSFGSGSSLSGALSCCEDSAQGSGQPKALTVAEGPSSCLRRNVISERERR